MSLYSKKREYWQPTTGTSQRLTITIGVIDKGFNECVIDNVLEAQFQQHVLELVSVHFA